MHDPTGGLAFPVQGKHGPREFYEPGMFLRDWFAGQALSGLLAGQFPFGGYSSGETDPDSDIDNLAIEAFKIADAMLAVRAKTMGGE